jgi:ATP-dependent helicase Lhr and Lhr-like helicase
MRWQRVAPRTQLSGEAGVLEALRQLEGFEAPAIEWERSLLPQRVAGYDPRWLDVLCLEGVVGWGRISPHPAFATHGSDFSAPKRVVPTSMAPVTFFLREDALWMDRCLAERAIPEPALQACLSELAWQVRAHLAQYGAVFAGDLVRLLGVPSEQVNRALWELVAAGLVTADGFDSLRVLIDPRRKAIFQGGLKRQRNTVGRWCLLNPSAGLIESVGAQAERREAEIESACWMLLRRYGVVFRDVLERETTIPRWRELQGMFRRLEARGNVRGGRFLSGFGGEQFAVPEAVASLRETRLNALEEAITVAAADPLNLAGVVVPGERPAAVPGKTVTFLAGAVRVEEPSLSVTAI